MCVVAVVGTLGGLLSEAHGFGRRPFGRLLLWGSLCHEWSGKSMRDQEIYLSAA